MMARKDATSYLHSLKIQSGAGARYKRMCDTVHAIIRKSNIRRTPKRKRLLLVDIIGGSFREL